MTTLKTSVQIKFYPLMSTCSWRTKRSCESYVIRKTLRMPKPVETWPTSRLVVANHNVCWLSMGICFQGNGVLASFRFLTSKLRLVQTCYTHFCTTSMNVWRTAWTFFSKILYFQVRAFYFIR